MNHASAPGGGGPLRTSRASADDRAQVATSPVQWRRVWALLRPHRLALLTVVVLIVASSLVSMAQPFLLRATVDHAIPDGDVRLLVVLVGGMVGVALVSQVMGVVQTLVSTRVGTSFMHQLRTKVFDRLQDQSLGFFTRTRGGEITSRLLNDVGGLGGVITDVATGIAANLTTAVATAAAMVALSWRLSLLSVLVVPVAVWVTRRVSLARRDVTARQQQALAELTVSVEESLSVSGARLIRTLGLRERRTEEFTGISRHLADLEVAARMAGRWRMATVQVVFATIPALVYLVAGLPATGGGMTIGTLIAFSALQSTLFRPLMGLLNTGSDWVTSTAILSRVFGYMDLRTDVPEPAADLARPLPAHPTATLRFDHVTFRHPGAPVDAVHDVSFELGHGRTLALVGETGSGKSTVAALADRLMDPSSGTVTLDGVDLRDLTRRDLTRVVGMVSQETYLVHDTIAANLRLARPDATDEELWEALEVARLADTVAATPAGLDTVVGARGHRFSGGEQQRLAIARTLLADPALLILDEATSALDNRTEHELQDALDRLSRGRTTLTIAHRLTTVVDADEILVLSGGRVVERGRHEDLVRAGGAYADLWGRAPAVAA